MSIKRSLLILTLIALTAMPRTAALSLDLDSVRTWGKVPSLVVDVYRWGDKFFNTYDSAYVQGTGYKFNGKLNFETWSDRYNFTLSNDFNLAMQSDQCTSMGFYISYLAVSLGYDINVSKLLGNSEPARKRFNFSFNCALLSADFYWITNNVSTRIKTFGPADDLQHYNIKFTGIETSIFGLNAVYNLNNKKYSTGAAFNFSKIQKQSQGSFFIGFSYWTQDFKFDFDQLPPYMRAQLPESWAENNYKYHASNHNYTISGGYGYNWVFAPNWVAGISEAPMVGIKKGYINDINQSKYSFSLYNRAKASVIWTNRRLFAGLLAKVETGLIYDDDHSLINNVFNIEATVGVRFNLW